MTVWLATTNSHKVREIRSFFQSCYPVAHLLDLKDLKKFLKDSDFSGLNPPGQGRAPGNFSANTRLFGMTGKVNGKALKKSNQRNRVSEKDQTKDPDSLKYLPPEETGLSFKENARIKSSHLLTFLKDIPLKLPGPLWILGEDSGLEVIALKGRPGIYSARYSGPEATDQKNNRLLLKNLRGQENRTARYVCALSCQRLPFPDGESFSLPENRVFDKTEKIGLPSAKTQDHKKGAGKPLSEKEGIFEGFCHGSIALEERGGGGFGYDPVFIPRGETKTLGELPSEFKEKISHRVQALKQFTKNLMVI